MIYREGQPSDFQHIETFVWQAIFPAYDHPDLNEAQRTSNDAIVESARLECSNALQHPEKWVMVAFDEKRKELAGYALVHHASRSEAQLLQFIVARRHWSKGVAQELFALISERLAACSRLLLSVHYYNTRAIAFFEKQGCVAVSALDNDAIIPQIWLEKDWQTAAEQAIPQAATAVKVKKEEEIDFPLAAEPACFQEEASEKSPEVPEEAWKLALEELLGTSFEDGAEEALLEEEEETTIQPALSLAEDKALVSAKAEQAETDFSFHYSPKERLRSWPRKQREKNRPKVACQPIAFEFAWGSEMEDKKDDLLVDRLAETALDEEEEGPSILFDNMGGSAVEVEWDIVLPPKGETAEDSQKSAKNTDKNQEKLAGKQFAADVPSRPAVEASLALPSKKELRATFREIVYDFASRLFGNRQAKGYVALSQTAGFELLLERALDSLLSALPSVILPSKTAKMQLDKRIRYSCEELAEYLIVGFGAELHGGAFPEAVLRYQASVWGKTDLFGLVNTYLDLAQEYEVVYRDFITMPSRKLRNATQNFLLARPQEVIYFIVDQSLLGNASNGFACTNRSLYWKNPLQPNHAIYFSDLESIKIASSCLWINGHFFDAGYSINLKLALLLEKIRRMQP